MALMKFREENQVKWMGSRPGHNGEQVLELQTSNNATVIIYTVPAGKTLYLCNWWITFWAGGVAGDAQLRVYDAAPAVWRILAFLTVAINESDTLPLSTFYPIEIPATYSIRITTMAAGHWARGGIHGWVE